MASKVILDFRSTGDPHMQDSSDSGRLSAERAAMSGRGGPHAAICCRPIAIYYP
jgi:hypothetical protein